MILLLYQKTNKQLKIEEGSYIQNLKMQFADTHVRFFQIVSLA